MTSAVPHTSTTLLHGPAALRELARALAHVSDFQRFSTGLENALGRAEFFTNAKVQLLVAGTVPDFNSDRLTLPLVGAERLHGALHVGAPAAEPGGTREFGPEDLHLMSSLAAVIAAAMDHAVRHGEQRRNLEILTFLLDLAPVGLAALHADGRIALANAAARRWLGAEGGDSLAERLVPSRLGIDWRAQPTFHLRLDGRLIYAEARSCASSAGAAGGEATAFVFADLTPQQAQLMDGLQRELYRARWLGQRLAFALVESPGVAGGILQRVPGLRPQMLAGEQIGPYDANRVGLVLPGLDPGSARARLRALFAGVSAAELTVATVPAESSDSAEQVLATALGQMRPLSLMLRPSLLLHDDYAAVNDTIALVLRDRYEVVKTTRMSDALIELRTRPFDALVTEVDLSDGGSGLELARQARAIQPSLRPVFTTVAHGLPTAANDPALAGHLFVRKPFDTVQLQQTIAAAVAPR